MPRATQRFKSSSDVIVVYLLRSNFALRASSARASASAFGVCGPALAVGFGFADPDHWPAFDVPLARLSGSPPSASVAGESAGTSAGANALFIDGSASTSDGSICEYSATRRVRVENSIALRKAISLRASGSCTARSSSGTSSGTLSSSCTSRLEMRAFSAFSISASRRFGCLISGARVSSVSRSPYSVMSCAAVLMPMPGTPGTLSTESPASACTSTTFSGGTPNFSTTSGMPMRRSFMVSYIDTQSVTSCIRSLSLETMVAVAPRSQASRT